ncbi:MAG: protein-tyrosine-phosphatase [Bacteroidota bacterium]
MEFYKTLDHYIHGLNQEFDWISPERKAQLEALSSYIVQRLHSNQGVQLVVICTHNSRRSHLGQIWLQLAAWFYNIAKVDTFSGGTEGTAFNPRAVAVLRRAGFEMWATEEQADNPFYQAVAGPAFFMNALFSKAFDHPVNPSSEFGAIMVCAEADEACPIVTGAERRFAIRYEDPKHSDGSPEESAVYDERCRQIAREAFYTMSKVKSMLAVHHPPAP